MKIRILALLLLLSAVTFNCVKIQAQVTVGAGNEPLPVSVLEIISDYQNGILGGLRLPQLTDAEIENLTTEIRNLPTEDKNRANGLIVFNTTTSCIAMWTGTEFRSLCGDIGPAKMDVNCAGIKIFPNNGLSPFTPTGYKQGTVLTAMSNYIEFPVTVDRRGTYSIAATTGNGYSFESSGTLLEVGDHLLTLRGQGTPINAATNTLSFLINGEPVTLSGGCPSPDIIVAPSSSFAEFTLDCASPSSVKVNGNYVKGKALDNSHSIELNVTFTTAGSASFSATGPGISFTGGGTYQIGTHKVVLQGSGTPTASGNQSITITGNSYTGSTSTKRECSTSVYIVRTIKVMGLGDETYQPGGGSNRPARTILAKAANFGVTGTVPVDGITIVNGGTTYGASLVTKIATENPDIIVIGYNYAYYWDSATRTALYNFVHTNKGVLIAFTQGNFANVTTLINSICGTSNITIAESGGGGTTYQFVPKDLTNPGKEALNAFLDGPFINLVGHSWGEDGGTTSYLNEAPAGTSVLTYHSTPSLSTRPTAIIHNTLGFIWAGDGGVLAGNGAGNTIYPCKHIDGSPAVKTEYSNGGAYNSYFYANAIAWAIGYVTTNRP
jgi:hypothetical protein